MTEAALKDSLVRLLRTELPGAVIFRHEDKFTAGIPDISVTWRKLTSWWEVKYLNPKLEGTEIQWVTTLLLEREGSCYYIFYINQRGHKRTFIVPPKLARTGLQLAAPDQCMATGYDHRFVANAIRRLHVDVSQREK